VPLHRRADVNPVEEQHAVAGSTGVHLGMKSNRSGQRGDHEAGPGHQLLRLSESRARLPDVELDEPMHLEPPRGPGQEV
jgi:hypothetical protein